ncbi:hypothetical protein BCV70DRAFT_113075 [Testicularia cyperi]|uniref:Uncharacterized protein n=1 Tax=Testicularia cyperi TaxID=1882483 RepID=A0A317XR67_9BASI|nr:hypothetical protein BCV70DRAFT_113075 [Testicularia cyperi]
MVRITVAAVLLGAGLCAGDMVRRPLQARSSDGVVPEPGTNTIPGSGTFNGGPVNDGGFNGGNIDHRPTKGGKIERRYLQARSPGSPGAIVPAPAANIGTSGGGNAGYKAPVRHDPVGAGNIGRRDLQPRSPDVIELAPGGNYGSGGSINGGLDATVHHNPVGAGNIGRRHLQPRSTDTLDLTPIPANGGAGASGASGASGAAKAAVIDLGDADGDHGVKPSPLTSIQVSQQKYDSACMAGSTARYTCLSLKNNGFKHYQVTVEDEDTVFFNYDGSQLAVPCKPRLDGQTVIYTDFPVAGQDFGPFISVLRPAVTKKPNTDDPTCSVWSQTVAKQVTEMPELGQTYAWPPAGFL